MAVEINAKLTLLVFCHRKTCPTDITTHKKRLQRGLAVEEKFQRVANYAQGMNREIEMVAHSCGLKHARELRREHAAGADSGGKHGDEYALSLFCCQ